MTAEPTVHDPRLADCATAIAGIVERVDDEHELTAQVAHRLRLLLADGLDLPAELVAPHPDHYVMRPLFIADDNSFSIACAVWGVGQGTPVHGHETWGVVGIHSGVEHETRYRKPHDEQTPLEALPAQDWNAGDVTVCCTTDDDVHEVRCGGQEPCVGIHVYGANIGALPRRAYDPATGTTRWFVSTWA